MNFLDGIFKFFRSGAQKQHSHDSAIDMPAAADWIVVGLGNPGVKYAATRHNVGYMAIDDLLAETGDVLRPVKGHKLLATTVDINGHTVVIARATTFMNLSGEGIAPLAQRLGVSPEHIIVVHDELDLPENKIRLKLGGNENGHNGLKSLTQHLGTRDYLRVRIGVGRPERGSSIPDYVLGPVNAGPGFDDAIALAALGIKEIISSGLNKAQNTIHSKG